jgi:predicted Fe-Mo cluster-binding NifX family protein
MQRIAIPITKGKLSESFGQCSHYEIFEIDNKQINNNVVEIPNVKDITGLPEWASKQGITDIITYKIDKQIINLFIKLKINLFVGIPIKSAQLLIEDYLNGNLKSDSNIISNIISGLK